MTKCYKFSKYTKRVYIGQENNGIGMCVSSDGDILEGFWEDGKLNGFGRHIYYWDGGYYVGEFVNGTRHGQGTWYSKDGSVEESGHWEDDIFIG